MHPVQQSRDTDHQHIDSLIEGSTQRAENPWRWVVIVIFVLANLLNFLDRQLLAASAPLIMNEFHLTNAQYGQLVALFSLAYAFTAPFFGAAIDRIGLRLGAAITVLMWSVASATTGLTQTFRGLSTSRLALAVGEAGALPCLVKSSSIYLPASEWGLASAVGSLAVAAGSTSAPLLVAFMAPRWGWRSTFLLSGALGILWVCLWLVISRMFRSDTSRQGNRPVHERALLSDRRLWGLALAYALVLVPYMFWLNWTTLYLVQDRLMDPSEANRYFAWVPPVFAAAGGFLSGAWAFTKIRTGMGAVQVRLGIAWMTVPVSLIGATVPWIPSAPMAIAVIGISMLFCMSAVTSLNIIPLDLFGSSHAALTIGLLGAAYTLTQAVLSPAIGSLVDWVGFAPVCVGTSLLPAAALAVLKVVAPRTSTDASGIQ